MKFHKTEASIFVPGDKEAAEALKHITHLSIGAHQDDSEIMAFHGIVNCLEHKDKKFGVVTCTNGGGSPRAGKYASLSDAEMAAMRRREQEKAAVIGDYGILIQLNYSSAEIKGPEKENLKKDLFEVLMISRPEIVYTHNPADKHDTHLAVCFASLEALRELPPERKPRLVLGCEVWRNLDWLDDEDKVPLNVGGHDNLAAALVGIFDSQIAGGKRYDLATYCRRTANATYFQSHSTDQAEALWFALDLSPVVKDDTIDPVDFVLFHVDKFRKSVEEKARKYAFGR